MHFVTYQHIFTILAHFESIRIFLWCMHIATVPTQSYSTYVESLLPSVLALERWNKLIGEALKLAHNPYNCRILKHLHPFNRATTFNKLVPPCIFLKSSFCSSKDFLEIEIDVLVDTDWTGRYGSV